MNITSAGTKISRWCVLLALPILIGAGPGQIIAARPALHSDATTSRTGNGAPRRFRIGNWLVEADLNRLSHGDTEHRIEPKLMEVLVTLAAHPGELVSKQFLLDTVWPDTVVVDGVLKRCIAELRRLFEDDAHNPRVIETIQRRGYRLLAPVATPVEANTQTAPVMAAAAAAIAAAPTAISPTAVRPSGRRQGVLLATVAGALAVAGIISYSRWPGALPSTTKAQPERPSTPVSATSNETIPAIAILPFSSIAEHDNKEWLALGLSEEIINSLSNLPNLRVIARTSSFAMRGRSLTIPQIARELNVGTVLEGSVRVDGKRLRVTAQLIDASTGTHIWSRNYDRVLTDVFEVQDTIAREIAASIPGVMKEPGKNPYVSRAKPYRDFDAYQLYLNALFLWRQRDAESHRHAAQLLEQAVAIDPSFSAAHGALANVYYTSIFYAALPYERMAALADQAAQRALQIDPHDSDALVVRCSLIKNRLEWEAAVPICRAAVKSNPQNSNAQQRLGETLLSLGYLRDGLTAVERAAAIDPLAASVNSVLALAQLENGNQQTAVATAALTRELGSPRAGQVESWIHAERKEWDLAAQGRLETAQLMKRMHTHIPAVYAAAAGTGSVHAALTAIAEATPAEAAREWQFSYEYTILRRPDLALKALLDSAPADGPFSEMWLPEFAPLRSSPGFSQVPERMGIAAYWRRHGPPDLCAWRQGQLYCR
jgi:TolB-like protein/DNA-binding winged helix-turn-helix (wHTH) protein/Tfp pilus assembly protein PilF